jgi:hypothetical protein
MYMVSVNGLNFRSWTCFKFNTFTLFRLEKRYHLPPYSIFSIDDTINYIEMAKILWIPKSKLPHIAHNSFI